MIAAHEDESPSPLRGEGRGEGKTADVDALLHAV
jgi:hypothetical protein